jgi:lysine 2,3-aminomutase
MNSIEPDLKAPAASAGNTVAVSRVVALTQVSGPVRSLKPPAAESSLRHRHLRTDMFWQSIPAYAGIDEATFLDHGWQARNSVTRIEKLLDALAGVASPEFLKDAAGGFRRAPMSVRISPYLLSLIDWTRPYDDPLRKQFVPVESRLLVDHPKLALDSLHEQLDAPVPGLTHRYADKVLFLALDSCPVYCRFCTRSYAVGITTETVEKVGLRANAARWEQAFRYIASRPEVEDVVVSGGDVYQLRASQITEIGERLLSIPQIRRIRFATKGPAVMPQKIITDTEWRQALVDVVIQGRRQCKEVALHTHFNHPNEITGITGRAMGMLAEHGVTMRNQCVLQRGVNDSVEVMTLLVKRLEHINVQPYYVYMHDLVEGVEDLRTSLQTAVDLEKQVRGTTAGFNTPLFVVDTPGGGGKRDVHSFEHYDRETGISVYTSPAVKAGEFYFYFDPLHALSPEVAARWADPVAQQQMIDSALRAAKAQAALPSTRTPAPSMPPKSHPDLYPGVAMTSSVHRHDRHRLATTPESTRQQASEFALRLESHPFLKRCSDGSITMPELRCFLVQHGRYAAYFTRYLCALISNLSEGSDVLALAANLAEELGLGAAAGVPHSRLYAQMLEDFDIDAAREPMAPQTRNLIDTMFMLCRQPDAVVGLGALCLGAEGIVPTLYSRVVQGFVSKGIAIERLRFFTLHIEEDDDHAATMYDILERRISESPINRDVAAHAGELAIHARLRFLDGILQAGQS